MLHNSDFHFHSFDSVAARLGGKDRTKVKVHASGYVVFYHDGPPPKGNPNGNNGFDLHLDGTFFGSRAKSRLLNLGAAIESYARSCDDSYVYLVTNTIPSPHGYTPEQGPLVNRFWHDAAYSKAYGKWINNLKKNYGLDQYFYAAEVQPKRIVERRQRALHFHMLARFDSPFLEYKAINKAWEKQLKGHKVHGNSVDFKKIEIFDNCPIGAYLAKYFSKDDYPVYCRRFNATRQINKLSKAVVLKYDKFMQLYGSDVDINETKFFPNDDFTIFTTFKK